jgi:hypothetical protein
VGNIKFKVAQEGNLRSYSSGSCVELFAFWLGKMQKSKRTIKRNVRGIFNKIIH